MEQKIQKNIIIGVQLKLLILGKVQGLYRVKKGTDGSSGLDGKSAYEIAVEKGFVGTEAGMACKSWENGLNGMTEETELTVNS